jgi:hypothetical protein
MDDVRIEGREVGRIGRAYLFSHHDSRGGSVLVVAPTLARALAAYAEHLGLDEQMAAHCAEEDYITRFTVVVCDQPLSPADDGAELLAGYREDGGYSWGVVQARWYDGARGRWTEWHNTAFALLWSGGAPAVMGQAGPLREELRLDVRDVGEDACGLILLWPATAS